MRISSSDIQSPSLTAWLATKNVAARFERMVYLAAKREAGVQLAQSYLWSCAG